jgi:Mlc titration factor MtfA (ptsG expression regulator)
MAHAKYGTSAPSAGSDYAKAMRSGEPPPTAYGEKRPAEDFADTVRLYHTHPAELKASYPKRYAVVDRLIKDPNYGG